jgi:DNA-binding transcriptional MerR regulator
VSEGDDIAPVDDAGAAARRPGKSEAAFRTISEVSEDLDVPQHVLRFWESKFSQIKPLKRGGGRRYYRPEDVQLLARIRDLLYKDGYTIRGVQQLLKDGHRGDISAEKPEAPAKRPGPKTVAENAPVMAGRMSAGSPPDRQLLAELLAELEELRLMLVRARRK